VERERASGIKRGRKREREEEGKREREREEWDGKTDGMAKCDMA